MVGLQGLSFAAEMLGISLKRPTKELKKHLENKTFPHLSNVPTCGMFGKEFHTAVLSNNNVV